MRGRVPMAATLQESSAVRTAATTGLSRGPPDVFNALIADSFPRGSVSQAWAQSNVASLAFRVIGFSPGFRVDRLDTRRNRSSRTGSGAAGRCARARRRRRRRRRHHSQGDFSLATLGPNSPVVVATSANAKRFLPRPLAAYSARSELAINASTVVPSSG